MSRKQEKRLYVFVAYGSSSTELHHFTCQRRAVREFFRWARACSSSEASLHEHVSRSRMKVIASMTDGEPWSGVLQ